MEQQNYANHRKLVPGFHFFTGLLSLLIFAFAAWKLVQAIMSGQWMFSDLM